jgi:ketosteroid isomerase-like protein
MKAAPSLLFALTLAALAGLSPAAAHDPTSSDPVVAGSHLSRAAAAAAATIDAFHAALRAGETAKAAALLADDVLVFEAGAAEASKAIYSAEHLAADAAFAKTAEETVLRRSGQSGGGMAWIASEGLTRTRRGDAVVERLTAESMILRRTTGGWRIVHVHWSSRPKPTQSVPK